MNQLPGPLAEAWLAKQQVALDFWTWRFEAQRSDYAWQALEAACVHDYGSVELYENGGAELAVNIGLLRWNLCVGLHVATQ